MPYVVITGGIRRIIRIQAFRRERKFQRERPIGQRVAQFERVVIDRVASAEEIRRGSDRWTLNGLRHERCHVTEKSRRVREPRAVDGPDRELNVNAVRGVVARHCRAREAVVKSAPRGVLSGQRRQRRRYVSVSRLIAKGQRDKTSALVESVTRLGKRRRGVKTVADDRLVTALVRDRVVAELSSGRQAVIGERVPDSVIATGRLDRLTGRPVRSEGE